VIVGKMPTFIRGNTTANPNICQALCSNFIFQLGVILKYNLANSDAAAADGWGFTSSGWLTTAVGVGSTTGSSVDIDAVTTATAVGSTIGCSSASTDGSIGGGSGGPNTSGYSSAVTADTWMSSVRIGSVGVVGWSGSSISIAAGRTDAGSRLFLVALLSPSLHWSS
jgi:hypothetical protein